MDPWWVAAAAVAMLTACVHTFLGGREIATPLLAASDLRTIPKLTSYYCWHLVTITLFAMAAGYGWAATSGEAREIGWACTALAWLFAGLAPLISLRAGVSLMVLPQWGLFVPMALLGLMGG
jgi:hypothetical protein